MGFTAYDILVVVTNPVISWFSVAAFELHLELSGIIRESHTNACPIAGTYVARAREVSAVCKISDCQPEGSISGLVEG